jgi:hypothetical protein
VSVKDGLPDIRLKEFDKDLPIFHIETNEKHHHFF